MTFSFRHTDYVITMPNMYARGILFGKMVLELGDTCTATNENNDIHCDLEFKTKVRLYLLARHSCANPVIVLTDFRAGFLLRHVQRYCRPLAAQGQGHWRNHGSLEPRYGVQGHEGKHEARARTILSRLTSWARRAKSAYCSML